MVGCLVVGVVAHAIRFEICVKGIMVEGGVGGFYWGDGEGVLVGFVARVGGMGSDIVLWRRGELERG